MSTYIQKTNIGHRKFMQIYAETDIQSKNWSPCPFQNFDIAGLGTIVGICYS